MQEFNEMLNNYLNEHFSDVRLESPLFYQAPIGLRFELGVSDNKPIRDSYFANVITRSRLIFSEIFDTDEQVMVVVKSLHCVEPYKLIKQGDSVFPKYLNDKTRVDQISSIELEKYYEDNGEISVSRFQYTLLCNLKVIDFEGILKAISHREFLVDPYITDEVFFIDPYRHMIFHMYDDRGVDVIAKNKQDLLPLYHKYNSWILAYDKERIDDIFMNS